MKIYKILAFVLGAMAFVSCNDKLDLDSDGHVDMSGVFKDRNSTRGYLNACYNYRLGTDLNASSLTDEAYDSRVITVGSLFDWWYNKGMTTDNFGSYEGLPWTSEFVGIRKCNVFIANMPNFTGYATDAEKAGWLAQAYCLRAYYYLQLFKRYGQVPLILTDIANTNYAGVKKAKVGEIVKQILADCDQALSSVEDDQAFSWNILDSQGTIFTRATAYAIKSEAILYAVSPLFDDGTYTWADAEKICGEALYQCLTHDYSLWNIKADGEAENAYAYYFLNTPFDKRVTDKESILTLNGQLSIWSWYGVPTSEGQGQAGVCPTQELVDAYEMANGEPAITGYSDADHLKPIINSASGYDESNPYANRDPRFYASVYYNGSQWYAPAAGRSYIMQTYEGGAEGISQKDVKHTPTGYYLRKYNSWRSSKSGNSDGYVRIFRLAELYMNFAEAAYQAGSPDTKVSIGGSMSMSARDAVNAIRERAGMPDLPAGMSKDNFQTRYRNERRIEFAFEGQRFYDLRRWKVMDDNCKVLSGMDITKDGSNLTYKRFRFTNRAAVGDKYLLYPLGRDEVNKMLKLSGENWQNSGWD
jgi:hypothetical protein